MMFNKVLIVFANGFSRGPLKLAWEEMRVNSAQVAAGAHGDHQGERTHYATPERGSPIGGEETLEYVLLHLSPKALTEKTPK